jgi:hypothetical protein
MTSMHTTLCRPLPVGLEHLQCYLMPEDIDEADTHLCQLLSTIELLEVGWRYFRTRLQKAWNANPGRLLPDPGKPYSALERLVLEWMEELFPYNRDYIEDVALEGERLPYIPLYDIGLDLEDLFDRSVTIEHVQGWRFLFLLDRNSPEGVTPEEEEEYELDSHMVEALFNAQRYSSSSWSWKRLDEECRLAPRPLCYLALAIRMIERSTGNLFLDPSPEMPVDDAEFNLHDVALLIRHWRQAHRIRQKADQLVGWIEAHPAHCRKVVDLWNRSLGYW